MRISQRAALAALRSLLPLAAVRRAAAQSVNGCGISVVNGLLQIDPECVITGPSGPQVTAPAHLAPQAVTTSTNAASPADIRAERMQRRRDNKHTRHFNRRDNRRDHSYRRRRRRTLRNRRQRDRIITCADFFNQKDALDFLAQYGQYANVLDPDGDGFPCEHLAPVTCSAFRNQSEARSWFERRGFTPANDPYKLVADGKTTPCTNLPA
ncbi:MAG: hypothetical protein IT305_17210 [Chloroflexi bacterium]|nr:hypothetical protein [Chloroflexota bacterium]